MVSDVPIMEIANNMLLHTFAACEDEKRMKGQYIYNQKVAFGFLD